MVSVWDYIKGINPIFSNCTFIYIPIQVRQVIFSCVKISCKKNVCTGMKDFNSLNKLQFDKPLNILRENGKDEKEQGKKITFYKNMY